MEIDEAIGTIEKITGIASVLVSAKIVGSALGFMSGRDSRAGQHFGDEFHALAVIVAREIVGNDVFKKLLGVLGDTAVQFSGRGVVIDFAAGWIGCLVIDGRLLKGKGICIYGVSAARPTASRTPLPGGL
jgi:hypothetical protein